MRALALGLLALLAASAAHAQVFDGELKGSDYWIQKPEGWNGGGLVVYARGYEGEGSERGRIGWPAIGGHLTSRGVAWAATGYRSRGYRPDWFLEDVLALRDHFIATYGKPRWTIIYGQSMGGHIAVAALEQHPGLFQGGLVECGVLDGVGQADWLKAYTAVAEYFSGLPLLDTPRPAFENLVYVDLVQRLGRPGSYTARGNLFDNVVKHLSGGDLPFRLQGMEENWLANLNPIDPGPTRAREFARHADTRHIRYDIDPGLGVDAATLNREIRRISPEPGARTRASQPVFAPFTGKLSAPLITAHETGDLSVPFRLQQDYRRRTVGAGTSHLLVQRAERKSGHCGLSNSILEGAFDDLVAWIERGVVPGGEDVLGDPSKLGLR